MFHVLDEIQLSSIGNIFTKLKCNKMIFYRGGCHNGAHGRGLSIEIDR